MQKIEENVIKTYNLMKRKTKHDIQNWNFWWNILIWNSV